VPLFWLSFRNPSKPKGQQFAGVALVEGDGPDLKSQLKSAISRAWACGCNPGGEIESIRLDDATLGRMSNEGRVRLARAPRNTLLSEADLHHHDLI
jgi:hypothetical protein